MSSIILFFNFIVTKWLIFEFLDCQYHRKIELEF
jgi:hypothetical protein